MSRGRVARVLNELREGGRRPKLRCLFSSYFGNRAFTDACVLNAASPAASLSMHPTDSSHNDNHSYDSNCHRNCKQHLGCFHFSPLLLKIHSKK